MNKTWQKLTEEILAQKGKTPCKVFGKSELGQELLCFLMGEKDDLAVLVQGAMHAREYITAFLCTRLVEYLSSFYLGAKVAVVPLVNPDGVRICLEGVGFVRDQSKKKLLKKILKNTDKKFFKANANGVDLNVNFDCHWGEGKHNVHFASFQNFVGYAPNSQAEVRALVALTKEIKPELTISFHSKGRVFYYGFKGQSKETKIAQKKLLKIVKQETKYLPVFTRHSAGGYKDFCLLKLGIVGFTIEVGDDRLSHPIGLENLEEIFMENKDVVLKLIKELRILKEKKR